MDKKEVCELIERFTTDDVLRRPLRKPWIVNGVVYATDGKIAIRLDNAAGLGYEHVRGEGDWRTSAAGDLDGWISESRAAIGSEKFELLGPYMSFLRKAAYMAMDDARKYALMVCDVVDAFGPVEFFVPAGGFKRGDYGRYRIWCHGNGVDVLLMAMRSDGMGVYWGDYGMAVADCATATLVHGISDGSFVDFSRLQFPKNEVHDGR